MGVAEGVAVTVAVGLGSAVAVCACMAGAAGGTCAARVLQQAGPQPQDTGHKGHTQTGGQRKQQQQRGNGNQGAHPANSRLQHRGNVISMDGPARSRCVRLRWSRGLSEFGNAVASKIFLIPIC